MGRYRKKPVVIEAVQLDWSTWSEVCDMLGDAMLEQAHGVYLDDYSLEPLPEGESSDTIGLVIKTLEGEMLGTQGDFIIKGVQGEFYPCKPDIFEATYEEVADES